MNIYCTRCGLKAMPTMKICPCGSGTFSPNPTAHAANISPREVERSTTANPKPASSAGIWLSVGVLFDIDNLGATRIEHMFYGKQARKIFMKNFDPRTAAPAVLWSGDTQKTLDGEENRFCIAITTSSEILESVIAAFSRLTDAGLAPPGERFCKDPVSLDVSASTPRAIPPWLSIDEGGG